MDTNNTERLFRRLLNHSRKQFVQMPPIKRVREMLERSPEQRLTNEILLEEFAIHCPQEDPKRPQHLLMYVGRFADLWASQPATGMLAVHGTPASAGRENAKSPSLKLPPPSKFPRV